VATRRERALRTAGLWNGAEGKEKDRRDSARAIATHMTDVQEAGLSVSVSSILMKHFVVFVEPWCAFTVIARRKEQPSERRPIIFPCLRFNLEIRIEIRIFSPPCHEMGRACSTNGGEEECI
jgi:hypothetical protein